LGSLLRLRWRRQGKVEKKRRDNLRRVIRECRRIVESDVVRKLRYYGIESAQFIDPKTLTYLTAADLEVRSKLEQAIEKEMVGGLSTRQAVTRYVSHVGFTYINRLAALRAMEVRGFIKETVIHRDKYGGMSLREMELIEREPSLTTAEALKEALIDAFKEVSQEIKVLFDVEDEYSIIFPETKTIKDLVRLLSEEITEEDWKQDDVIGWIYQYYNDEARREFRASRRRPAPDDIPVINQFYTPQWIVKALVDNTLGKLWLNAHPGSKIREFCDSLASQTNESREAQPTKAREIRVLDPACGSGHFLLYAFDVFFQIYKEDEPDLPDSEIPSLILENNLYGIDIDLRAVQLAALSLYLKAKTYSPKMRVQRINLVCADVRISDGERRKEFLRRFDDDPPLKQIFEKLFESLGYTYEIGSLLKVRAPFEQLFRERKSEYVKAEFDVVDQTQLSERGVTGQSRFMISDSETDQPSIVLAIPKERTIEEMLEELTIFEREAFEANDMGRLLFATETHKSVGLLALLSQRYDVVLMNPPYGDMPPRTKEYLLEHYRKTHYDYYAAFMEQAVELAKPGGYVGALVGRTFMFLRWFQWVREVLFGEKATLQLILDLGFGVLDVATARWAAYTARKPLQDEPQSENEIVFVRLLEQRDEPLKKAAWEEVLQALNHGGVHPLIYRVALNELSKIPGTPFSYWTSRSLRELFTRYPPLDRDVAGRPDQPKIADVKQGLATGDDNRFTRFWWEVPTELIAVSREETLRGKKWVTFANEGGTEEFYVDFDVVLDWDKDGQGIKNYLDKNGKPLSRPQNEGFYFREGVTWSLIVSSPRLCYKKLMPGIIIGVHGSSAFLNDRAQVDAFLSLGNSSLLTFLFTVLDPLQHVRHVGYMSKLPVNPEALTSDKLRSSAQEAYSLKREWLTGSETSALFIKPWILQVLNGFNSSEKPINAHPLAGSFEWSKWSSAVKIRSVCGNKTMNLKELVELCVKRKNMLKQRIDDIQRQIDEEVYSIYNISNEDQRLIERELDLQGGLKLTSDLSEQVAQNEGKTKITEEASEHIKRLISFYVKKVMESDEDGIVPLDQSFQDNLVKKVRELIALDFGKERVDDIEKEMEEILGSSLQDWLANEFFDFHLTLYRRRPIFWQLTSRNFGTGRGDAAFSCFVYYHKLSRDTIPKIQAIYLMTVKEKVKVAKEQISDQLIEAQKEGDKKRIEKLKKDYQEIDERLAELERFDAALTEVHNPRKNKSGLSGTAKWIDRAIAEVRDNGWNPIIDYGVRVNIEPLKEARVLPPSASRVR
jgi:hypothetical protein